VTTKQRRCGSVPQCLSHLSRIHTVATHFSPASTGSPAVKHPRKDGRTCTPAQYICGAAGGRAYARGATIRCIRHCTPPALAGKPQQAAGHGRARQGPAGPGTARHGTARHGTARHGTARHNRRLHVRCSRRDVRLCPGSSRSRRRRRWARKTGRALGTRCTRLQRALRFPAACCRVMRPTSEHAEAPRPTGRRRR
jgi:hypothetical protein